MASSNNNILITLASINVLGFIIILFLFWMLWDNNRQLQEQNITINSISTQSSTSEPVSTVNKRQALTTEIVKPAPSVNAKDLSIISAVAKEIMSNNIATNQRFDFKIPKPTQRASSSNISGSKKVFSDEEYIAIFNQVNSKKKSVKKEYSEADVLTQAANKKVTPANDHFNKVDISHITPPQTKILSLAQQVAMAATVNKNDVVKQSNNSDEWEDYLSSIKEAETERQNEMRTITVKQGETLWQISTRAYGTGYSYKKIFAANPHLTNPDSISVGETLRVPL